MLRESQRSVVGLFYMGWWKEKERSARRRGPVRKKWLKSQDFSGKSTGQENRIGATKWHCIIAFTFVHMLPWLLHGIVVCSTREIPLQSILWEKGYFCRCHNRMRCNHVILLTNYPFIRLFWTPVSLAPHIDDTLDIYGDWIFLLQKNPQHKDKQMKNWKKKKLIYLYRSR